MNTESGCLHFHEGPSQEASLPYLQLQASIHRQQWKRLWETLSESITHNEIGTIQIAV